jgi:hypothetical protein
MTTRELIHLAGQHWPALLGLFLVAPAAAVLCSIFHGPGNGGNAPWKYLYSVLVYLACVPGTFAAVLTAYTLFFSKENLLDVNPLVYFFPIVSMIVTLVFIRKVVAFDLIPGFERLSGLMVMIACSFAIALAVQKTRIFLFFGGSIIWLITLAAGVFALLKWGAYTLFGSRDEPPQQRPKFPLP